jgi:hypothetical protein
LSDQMQCVRSDGEYSTIRGIEYGDPQGSVLGRFLFISSIDDVSDVIHFSRLHIYADDLQIYHSSSVADLQRCYGEVNADLKRIFDWAESNRLKLNPKKRQVILIQKRGGDVPEPELFIGPDLIELVPKVRNFGSVLNGNLTPVDQYKAVCQRIYSILRSVKPQARYTPFGNKKKLVVSLRLNVAFNSCLHYVHDILRREYVSHLVPTIIGDPLVTHLRIIRHPCNLYTFYHFASSARTRNLIVTPHRSHGPCAILQIGGMWYVEFSSTSD